MNTPTMMNAAPASTCTTFSGTYAAIAPPKTTANGVANIKELADENLFQAHHPDERAIQFAGLPSLSIHSVINICA